MPSKDAIVDFRLTGAPEVIREADRVAAQLNDAQKKAAATAKAGEDATQIAGEAEQELESLDRAIDSALRKLDEV